MLSLAGSILASMVIDDMLKNDGGQEATKLMRGGYKRKAALENSATMGSTLVGSIWCVQIHACAVVYKYTHA